MTFQSAPAAHIEDLGCNTVQDALFYTRGCLVTYIIYIRSKGAVCTQGVAGLSL